MKKRFLSAALALAMCLGLAVPAFAVDIEDATREDIKNAFTIVRNGTVDETKRVYTSGKRVPLNSYAEGWGYVAYEVFDKNDSWTITNTGSKAISANGRTDYTISFGYCTYGRDPGSGTDVMEEIGGSGSLDLDENGRPYFLYGDAPANPVNLKAGESITIPASALGDSSPDQAIYELMIYITYDGGDWADSEDVTRWFPFYFGYDPAERAAIEQKLTGNKPAPSFTDVPGWCANAVGWAVDNGITTGTGNNKFSPDKSCTHEQILTFLYRAQRGGSGTASAADMAAAVNWAREKGMIDEDFDPKAPCTRADAMIYIWEAFDFDTMGGNAWETFTDITVEGNGQTLCGAINFALERGITNGYANGDGTYSFRPDRVCKRGEIVTFLYRAYVPEASLAANS